MPVPTNISPATATVISSLPFDIVEDANDGGTTRTLYFSYTGVAGDNVIGIWGKGASPYFARCVVYGPNSSTSIYLGFSSVYPDKPFQMPVTVGATYLFAFDTPFGDVSPAVLTLSILRHIDESVPAGAIFVHDDTAGFPLAIIDPTDGHVLKFVQNVAASEHAAILRDGTSLVGAGDFAGFQMYNARLENIATVLSNAEVVGSNRVDAFYIGDGAGLSPAVVQRVSNTGVIGGTTWGPVGNPLLAIEASEDETILYYQGGQDSFESPIKRWNLLTNTAMSDLVGGLGGYNTCPDILVLRDGTIVIGYQKMGSQVVKHYSAAGATLNTYDLTASEVLGMAVPDRLAYALDDPTSFWFWQHRSDGFTRFVNVRISDGAILAEPGFTSGGAVYTDGIKEFQLGQYEGIAADDAALGLSPIPRFGHSDSCTFLILRQAVPLVSLPNIVNNSAPCCETSPPSPTSTGATGPQPTVMPLFDFQRTCEGGGEVPSAPEIIDSESWAV